MDGTLVDTYELILVSFRHTVREVLGRDYPDDVLMAKVGQPLDVQMWDFTDDEAMHDRLRDVYRAYNAEIHDRFIKRFPGTREAVERIMAAGLPVGVVTSKRHAPAMAALASCGISDLFDVVVGSDDWPEHKPAPGPVLRGCELLGVAPDACAYVGDSPFDMQAGNAADCTTVAATWGMFAADVLAAENPAVMCSDLGEVADFVIG